ncbi:MAG: phosphatase domain-containing protein [Bifidobacterium bifidum]
MLAIPASRVQVRISIDGTPLETVQIGESERYDEFNPVRDLGSEYAVSDESGYLDLVAEHQLETGVHRVTYRVKGRPEVSASLFTIPSSAKVGIISDVDDTVMVTQAPILWKAAYNLLFLNPKKRNSVPGMSVLFTKLQDMFPDAPFFYLSTSPERGRIDPAFHLVSRLPEAAAVARPRPAPEDVRAVRSAAQAGVRRTAHGGLPDMRFILIGDDGQKDPTTYATIARRYPGRVLAIGIRQLSPREATGLSSMMGMTSTQPMPVTDVPVFTGTTGSNIMKTKLPYLKQKLGRTDLAE